jgi:putative membrane protein
MGVKVRNFVLSINLKQNLQIMKNSRKLISGILLTALFCVTTFGLSSCDNKPKTEDTKEVAEDKNEAKMDGMKDEADAQFLVDVAEINQTEISLGKLAQKKGSMADVKELGKMMVEAHVKGMTDLSALAMSKSISLPEAKTDDVNEAYKEMNEKSGMKFDVAYCEKMVDGHKDAISKFEKASTDAVDPDIKAMAVNMLPDLHKHLEMAEMCKKKCEAMK